MMKALRVEKERIKSAWEGRISGCQLGKPVEVLSILKGFEALTTYLKDNHALPLRDYVPFSPDPLVERMGKKSCKGNMVRSREDPWRIDNCRLKTPEKILHPYSQNAQPAHLVTSQ